MLRRELTLECAISSLHGFDAKNVILNPFSLKCAVVSLHAFL